MKENTACKGITLISLIITIVILLILAVVTIGEMEDSDIIGYAQRAEEDYTEAEEKGKISIALLEWEIQKDTQREETTFIEYMEDRIEGAIVTDNGDGTITVGFKNNAYKVKEDGTITTSTKGINITNTKLTMEFVEGETITSKLTASLRGIEGEISWSNSNNSIATISGTTGSTITVTAVEKGETIVIAKCGKYSATCTVIVADPIEVGTCVEYDVEYIDMYSGNEYNKYNGWRYLGKDDNGNYLIVSTAIPVILQYNYQPTTKPQWWGEDADIARVYGEGYSTNGWNYSNKGYTNRYVAYGLRYKLERIPFTYKQSGTSALTNNTGIFRKVGNTTSGTSIELDFKAEGVNVLDAHNLTLAELNRATNSASGSTRADTSTSTGFKEIEGSAEGLFDMKDLDNYTANYYYWLASPNFADSASIHYIAYNYDSVRFSYSHNSGVRPVVTLSSNIQLKDTNNDGILEIK